MVTATVLACYFVVLYAASRIFSGRGGNDTFFRGNRSSPWWLVAFGMVGASVSGITFISVTGMVAWSQMTYLQACAGYILGYFVVAFVLLPIYYRLNLTTIYTYLGRRLGPRAYRTGSAFFVLSKLSGAAARFYVVCLVLEQAVMAPLGIPFAVTAPLLVLLIWLYTRNGGISTLVRTDVIQTACMLLSLILIIHAAASALGLGPVEAIGLVMDDPRSRILELSDWSSPQHFLKQFVGGIFIVVVMTGLDQDMMQKNLTCKSEREAKVDMCAYSFAFVPLNLLFMSLGILLLTLCAQRGISVPSDPDLLLPTLVGDGTLGLLAEICFALGIVAASFSSADSSLTALTTSTCVDLLGKEHDERLRRRVHALMAALFALAVLCFGAASSTSLIDAIFILCGYTYGPLLGLFAFAILTRRQAHDRAVPWICCLAPLACLGIDQAARAMGYRFGYEMLLLNGALTFAMLFASGIAIRRDRRPS
ncbi:MAG: sodium:solute symporter [Succinivibrionaceae bacterium]|nr:sodium:solute symporter [Succinivibrionaceae bacterium]